MAVSHRFFRSPTEYVHITTSAQQLHAGIADRGVPAADIFYAPPMLELSMEHGEFTPHGHCGCHFLYFTMGRLSAPRCHPHYFILNLITAYQTELEAA